uniref:Uncharacterized protein n=1 Tax=Candidatus Kentrum sp. LPFa TaxID=2126335 RepID=A0A450XJ97_9GAMM|nr:MAG: hypothetical protein BECKLPF1236A_GA0070988_100539 [Candidatus Kentron sp. LPFa]VFK29400.1 MAG: hypothetical protein BECKLPF1236C_GA0070990_100866 [Candidatus Kentron sp. LPFa]
MHDTATFRYKKNIQYPKWVGERPLFKVSEKDSGSSGTRAKTYYPLSVLARTAIICSVLTLMLRVSSPQQMKNVPA